ncbi:MAG: hypothetical protein GYB40_03230 [Vibrionaceae bacterium]|nr:hypothetical protein [Vibrionaceae bacterium]
MMVFNSHFASRFKLFSTLLTVLVLSSSFAFANPTDSLLHRFNQAEQGDPGMVDSVHDELSALLEQQGATPLTLVYLGCTQNLQGRDAFMPWNKMKFAERGLATIQKGLDLMASQPIPVQEQQRLQGLPEYQLATAMAATTYTALPDMFNHFERGYELYLALLNDPSFQQQPFSYTAWVYRYGIEAALRADDQTQAKAWLAEMERIDYDNPETQNAKSLIAKH